MRLVWFSCAAALAAITLSACQMGRDWHEQRALEECDDLINADERMACEQRVRDENWKRDAEARSKKDDE